MHLNRDWIERSNAVALYHIERQGRTDLGVVPFLGAGISKPFGLKDWKGLLLDAAPPTVHAVVASTLDADDYEDAAEILLKELGDDRFQSMVAASAGDRNIEAFDFTVGGVSLLPLIARGPVVTTNFDRVAEMTFKQNAAPFDAVISGPRPDLIVDALLGNRRVLIKLHGDWQDRVGRTFARSDYETNYGEKQPEKKRALLAGVERLLFSARSLLFVGASLQTDRTVELLQRVHREHAGIHHFAIMSAPSTATRFHVKERKLRDCGVMPLWYVAKTPEDHPREVERMLEIIVERLSVQTIPGTSGEAPLVRRPRPVPPKPPDSTPPDLVPHFERIVTLIQENRVNFFLGSAITYPQRFTAAEFYGRLARLFNTEALNVDRFAVAQYIVDRHGRESLNAEIRRLFAETRLIPQDTHRFFAAWDSFRTQHHVAVPYPTVLTTNYDDVMERALHDAGIPYHLLSYQADGPHRGRFFHRDTADNLRLIERPENIRKLSGGFVLVKLNGGLDRQRRIRESFATTRLDYWDLASRIPGVLPQPIQARLAAHPLLFLGHGLAAADVESVVRFAHKDHPGLRSWAVVTPFDKARYWEQCGVEIVEYSVNRYVNELWHRLTSMTTSPPGGNRTTQRRSGALERRNRSSE